MPAGHDGGPDSEQGIRAEEISTVHDYTSEYWDILLRPVVELAMEVHLRISNSTHILRLRVVGSLELLVRGLRRGKLLGLVMGLGC